MQWRPGRHDGDAADRALGDRAQLALRLSLLWDRLAGRAGSIPPGLGGDDPDLLVYGAAAVGFGIGMGAWRFAPGVFGAIKLLSNPATLRDLLLRWLTSMRPTP